MLNGVYHVIVIIVAVWGIFTGFRKGFLRQIGVMLGIGFGIVATRMASPECMDFFEDWIPKAITGFKRSFLLETLTCSVIYLVVAFGVELLTIPLGRLAGKMSSGVFNSICGAVCRLFQYIMILSIVYNIIVDLNPKGELTYSSRLHDGNIVEGVMKVAPAILGFPDGEEVGYQQQLEDAKKIS